MGALNIEMPHEIQRRGSYSDDEAQFINMFSATCQIQRNKIVKGTNETLVPGKIK
jgi:hypothetical protein